MKRRKLVVVLSVICFLMSVLLRLCDNLVLPLISVSSSKLEDVILVSPESCTFQLSVETISGYGQDALVMDGWSALFLDIHHIWNLHRQFSLRDIGVAVWSQMSVLSIYEELILSEKVWVTVLSLCLVHFSIDVMVFRPISHLCIWNDKDHRTLVDVERAQFKVDLEKSFIEIMVVILFVLTRSYRSTERENMLAAGMLPQPRITTEASVFFVWLAIIWSIQSVCDRCCTRLGQLLNLPFNSYMGLYYAVWGVQLISIGVSGSILSVALCSFGLLHPFYSWMLTFEAISTFLHTIQCLTVSACKSHCRSLPQWISLLKFAENFFIALDTCLLLVLGCLVNGNIVCICLVSKLVYSIKAACRDISQIG